jgi:uncharacterized OB-fold protein
MTTGILEQHQAHLNQGNFYIQKCLDCEKLIYFPREFCPHCSSTKLDWHQPTGLGTIYALTTVRRKLEAGGDYNVSLIQLEEGVRMMSRVENNNQPLTLKIGDTVKARVAIDDKGIGLVLFDLVKGS